MHIRHLSAKKPVDNGLKWLAWWNYCCIFNSWFFKQQYYCSDKVREGLTSIHVKKFPCIIYGAWELNLCRDNQRVIYTSPLKALSNQVSSIQSQDKAFGFWKRHHYITSIMSPYSSPSSTCASPSWLPFSVWRALDWVLTQACCNAYALHMLRIKNVIIV